MIININIIIHMIKIKLKYNNYEHHHNNHQQIKIIIIHHILL